MSTSTDPFWGEELVRLARRTIASGLSDDPVEPPNELVRAFSRAAGVFVTIRTRSGALRGCVGTQVPTCEDIPHEVVRVAPLAAFADPRFPPVGPYELPSLLFEVSILTPLEWVRDPDRELDPHRYGVSVEDTEGRRALLLPGISGIDSVAEQLSEVRKKAGIDPNAPIRIERFEIEKFLEAPE